MDALAAVHAAKRIKVIEDDRPTREELREEKVFLLSFVPNTRLFDIHNRLIEAQLDSP